MTYEEKMGGVYEVLVFWASDESMAFQTSALGCEGVAESDCFFSLADV